MKKTFLMTLALLCALAQGAWAEAVSYIYYTVDEETHVVTKHTGSQNNYNTITHSTRKLDAGVLEIWWVVSSNVTIDTKERLDCYGKVNIILKDGCTLTVPKGIRVSTDCTLNIYAQSEDEATMGGIHAEGGGEDWAAIGGHKNYVGGSLYIHGGNIYAEAKNNNGAGIGGGNGEKSGMKLITIYNGKITAKGKNNGAGIGAGKRNNTVGTINIYGGTVTANGGDYAAGIGGAEDRGGWHTNIYGGTIKATGGPLGAGIGGGWCGDGGNITIYGGNIEASGTGKRDGLYAYGDAAGIGGGYKGKGGNITINGGDVKALASNTFETAAGIGGGGDGDGGTIIINGGKVYAVGGHRLGGGTIAYGSSGIGAGYNGEGAKVTINGCVSVEAIGGAGADPFGILTLYRPGTFAFNGAMCVESKKQDDSKMMVPKAKRYNYCANLNSLPPFLSYFVQSYAKVSPCDHAAMTYTDITAGGHSAQCIYCDYSVTNELHQYIAPSTVCDKCGYGEGVTLCTLAFPTASVEGYASAGFQAVQGQTIALPECTTIPSGYKFAGWLKQSTTPTSIEAADSETSLLQPGDSYTVDGNATFYARYRLDFTEEWTWSDGLLSATLRLTNQGSQFWPTITLSGRTVQAAKADSEGYITATATATYTSGNTTYTFTNTKTVPTYYTYELGEGDNTSTLETANGLTGNVQLTGRTLYKDGKWNTLCLPFDLVLEGSPLEGATVKGLESAAFSNGTLTLNFYDATSIKAGRPYLIRWDSGTALAPSNLIFNGVTISSANNDEECAIDNDKSVTFRGTYSLISYAVANRNILYLGSGNTLYYPAPADADHPVTIGAQRAYFQLDGLTAGDIETTDVRAFALNFGDESSTQGVTTPLSNRRGAWDDASWYTLDGRRLSGKPSRAGIYINNGVKVIIK